MLNFGRQVYPEHDWFLQWNECYFLISGRVTKDNQTIIQAHIAWFKTIIAQVKSLNSQTFCLIFAVNVRLPIHSLRSSIPCVNIILDNAMNCSQSIFNLIIQFIMIWLTLFEFWFLCPLNFLQERAKWIWHKTLPLVGIESRNSDAYLTKLIKGYLTSLLLG